jgi:hypothetical protein
MIVINEELTHGLNIYLKKNPPLYYMLNIGQKIMETLTLKHEMK